MAKRHATDHTGKLRPFFSPEKIAEALGVHRKTVLRMIQRKELVAYSIRPGVLRVPETEIERLLRSRCISGPQEPEASQVTPV